MKEVSIPNRFKSCRTNSPKRSLPTLPSTLVVGPDGPNQPPCWQHILQHEQIAVEQRQFAGGWKGSDRTPEDVGN